MAYQRCRFCGGRGCLACDGERERDWTKVRKEPVLVVKVDPETGKLDEKGMAVLKAALSRKVVETAYKREEEEFADQDATGIAIKMLNGVQTAEQELMQKLEEAKKRYEYTDPESNMNEVQ